MSGYQHFEYVYNALRHGIVDYLLKPINREELNNALEVIISRHQKDLYENNRTRNLERSLQQAQKSLVTRYLNDIIGGRAQDLTTENLELYGLDWHRDRYGCFALRVDTAHYEDFVSATIESAVSKMESQIRQLSCDAISPPLLQIRDSSIFCLYNYDSLHPDAMQKYYDTVLSTANCVAAMFPEMHVTMGIGRSCASLSDLPRATEDAIQAVRSRIMLGVDRIIYAETLNSSSSAVEALVEGRWPELWQTLQTCDQSSFSELLSSLIFDEAVTTSPIGPHTLTIALLRQFCLANSEDPLNGFDAKQFAAELTGQLSHIWNRRQLCRMLDDAFADYIRCLKNVKAKRSTSPSSAPRNILPHTANLPARSMRWPPTSTSAPPISVRSSKNASASASTAMSLPQSWMSPNNCSNRATIPSKPSPFRSDIKTSNISESCLSSRSVSRRAATALFTDDWSFAL